MCIRDSQQRAQPIKSGDIVEEDDEMDISAAHASAPQTGRDLLDLSEHNLRAPSHNRFNTSRQDGGADASVDDDFAPLSPSSINGFSFDTGKESRFGARPSVARSRTRLSMEEPRRLFDHLGERRRRYSLSFPRRMNLSSHVEDDLEGDLGYAAAEDQDRNRRKVIVERLETVKSRNPVFTWC